MRTFRLNYINYEWILLNTFFVKMKFQDYFNSFILFPNLTFRNYNSRNKSQLPKLEDISQYKWLVFLSYQLRKKTRYYFHLYINLVCLFDVSNKRQNGWTDRAQIFCGTSHDHREGLWIINILKMCFEGF